ncbi:MAG: tRNA-intron lyase [Thermoproteaceae archaeon]|jgi:tRNA-intron endonuclease|nr:tRNA-intron lyase [Thermoproteaceae archaeon]
MIGVLRGLAVIVDNVEYARKLYKEGFYGRFLGYDKIKLEDIDKINTPLILSLFEAVYLAEGERLKVLSEDGMEIPPEKLMQIGRERIKDFEEKYKVYKHFRDLGYIVKSGLKFGAMFSVYERGPGIDHAPLVVVFLEPDRGISAIDITRGGRLSHSVRKTFTLATVLKQTGEIVLLGFTWAKL